MARYQSSSINFLISGKTCVEDAACSLLYSCLKDYKEEEPIRLMCLNKTRMLRSALRERGVDPKGPIAVKTPVEPITISFTSRIDPNVRKEVLEGLKALQFFRMPYHLKDMRVRYAQKSAASIVGIFTEKYQSLLKRIHFTNQLMIM